MTRVSPSTFILQPLNFSFTPLNQNPRIPRPLTPLCSTPNHTKPPVQRKPTSHGPSRRSATKKSFSQEQVSFNTPISDNPSVAIIGGGISGLLCAATLEERGIRSTVFDTGVHGLGGRMATREILEFHQQHLVFDHAAQFFTARDPRFQKLVDRWLSEGLIREWLGLIGVLESGGRFTAISRSAAKYIGMEGMRPFADSILKNSNSNYVQIIRPCWISKLEPFNAKWHLKENQVPRGGFDAVVVAHNGKCANRLLAYSGLPMLFRQMKRLELSSIWALLAAFEDPLPVPGDSGVALEGAFVKGVESVSWMGNNTSKLVRSGDGVPQCWTFFSTAGYGRRNKVPQENIPNVTAERVKREMLEGVESALGLSRGSIPPPVYARVQLWGAALPTNTPGVPCMFDPYGRAGICGDWLLGSSMEDAAISGISLGNHMADYFECGGGQLEEFSVGLHDSFGTAPGHDIGHFPGLDIIEPVFEDSECVPC